MKVENIDTFFKFISQEYVSYFVEITSNFASQKGTN